MSLETGLIMANVVSIIGVIAIVAFALWIRSHDDGADLSDSHVQSEEQN
jgi:hypothetical protein